MKKYFAKYLSIEDEIKEGDHVVDATIAPKDGLEYKGADYFLNAMGDTITLPNWKERFKFKKQKLFLCSRDFSIGDTIKNIDTQKERKITTDAELQLANMQSGVLIKVIGEISSEAVWTKEGDDFNEDELKWVIFNTLEGWGEMPFDKGNELIKSTHQVPGEYIKIKCPTCHHFH